MIRPTFTVSSARAWPGASAEAAISGKANRQHSRKSTAGMVVLPQDLFFAPPQFAAGDVPMEHHAREILSCQEKAKLARRAAWGRVPPGILPRFTRRN